MTQVVPRAQQAVRSTSHKSGTRHALVITRRGRWALRIMMMIGAIVVVGAGVFRATGAAAEDSSTVPVAYVIVHQGQSLWDVAVTVAPNRDPRDVVIELVQLNHLLSSNVIAGTRLAVPAQ